MANVAARAYIVGFLTGSGLGLLAGWVLNSAPWYNGSTAGTPLVAGAMTLLCGSGVVIYALGPRGEATVAGGNIPDPASRDAH